MSTKIEVSKTFVQEAYDAACPQWQQKIEDEVKGKIDLYDLQPNTWVVLTKDYTKLPAGLVVPIKRKQDGGGESCYVVRHTIYKDYTAKEGTGDYLAPYQADLRPATVEEIIIALGEEAEKRFKHNQEFISAVPKEIEPTSSKVFTFYSGGGFELHKDLHYYKRGYLFGKVNLLQKVKPGSLFYNWKWATPLKLKEITKEEAEKKLPGYKII